MKLLDKKSRSEMMAFLHQCRIHRGEAEFRRLVLQGYRNPNFLELESRGEEYPGQIIYQIGAYGYSVGFFAEFLYLLIRLYFAEDRGFVPYVYWGEDFLYYEKAGMNGKENAFEYYFEPVTDVQSVKNASHVLLANHDHIHAVQDQLNTHGYAVSEEYIAVLSRMIQKYIRYNQNTLQHLENSYRELIGEKKALAVHFRGTDYRRQYNNHPVFVTIEQEIEKAKELLREKDYEVIFLATDEQDAVERFQKEFGNKVKCFSDTWRAEEGDESVAYSHGKRDHHRYLLGLEVIRDQYMLTRCKGLVCGVSNLTLSARMMRRAWYETDYDDLVILNEELCHNNRNFCDAKH